MKLTVKDILDLEVFKSYKILSGLGHLKKNVESVSFIEVPDYDKYMVPNSILITTLMSIKENEKFLYDFILDLSANNISALVIKDKGFFKPISKEIINLANKLKIVIIILEDDCNLSHIMNDISNIIYSNQTTLSKRDFQNISLAEMFCKIENYEDLINAMKNLDNIQLYIEIDENNYYCTSIDYYNEINQNKTLKNKSLFKLKDSLIIKKEVIINDKLYCTFYLSVSIENQSFAFEINEYITLILFLIKNNSEKKLNENEEKLKNFMKYISNISEHDESLKHVYKNINFPLGIFFFKNSPKSSIGSKQTDYLYEQLTSYFNINNRAIKGFITPKYTVFIFNVANIDSYEQDFYKFISNIFQNINDNFSNIFLSKIIRKGSDIESFYLDSRNLIYSLEKVKHIKPTIYLGDYDTLNLLKNIDEKTLLNFMKDKLKGLFDYQNTNNELIETLHTLILSNFQLKTCSSRLFIHYNTLRYRINLLEESGFDIKSINFNSTDVSIAIFIYYFIYLPKNI